MAMQFLSPLQKRKSEVLGEKRGIYGRSITAESKFVLLLAQAAGLDESENTAFFQKLRRYAEERHLNRKNWSKINSSIALI